MSDFRFNDWNDEFFKKEFLKFLNEHEKKMSEFMRQMYNQNPEENNDFKKINDYLNKITGDFNQEQSNTESFDDLNSWDKSSWFSPNGSSMFTSYSRDFNPNLDKKNLEKFSTLELLEEKLNKSIINEDYESAAKIRDLIKDISNKSEN